ncbi:hypothetical protein GCM10027073_29330 [Streptomyces chlorus]
MRADRVDPGEHLALHAGLLGIQVLVRFQLGQVGARLRAEVAALHQCGAQQCAAPLEDQEAERLGVPGCVDPVVEELAGLCQLHLVLFIPGHFREQCPDGVAFSDTSRAYARRPPLRALTRPMRASPGVGGVQRSGEEAHRRCSRQESPGPAGAWRYSAKDSRGRLAPLHSAQRRPHI